MGLLFCRFLQSLFLLSEKCQAVQKYDASLQLCLISDRLSVDGDVILEPCQKNYRNTNYKLVMHFLNL